MDNKIHEMHTNIWTPQNNSWCCLLFLTMYYEQKLSVPNWPTMQSKMKSFLESMIQTTYFWQLAIGFLAWLYIEVYIGILHWPVMKYLHPHNIWRILDPLVHNFLKYLLGPLEIFYPQCNVCKQLYTDL